MEVVLLSYFLKEICEKDYYKFINQCEYCCSTLKKLTNSSRYCYDPIMWNLFYVCHDLYCGKPIICKKGIHVYGLLIDYHSVMHWKNC